jgi:DNA-binding MarR family transcriptional regulator
MGSAKGLTNIEMKRVPRAKKTGSRGNARTASDTAIKFDDEGVQLAILAALEDVYESFPHITLPQYLIALEVRKAERDGAPHTLASLVKQLKMPFSTVSRVVWSLTEEGGDIGVVRYLSHPTDRRKKQLVINPRGLPSEMSLAAARAMHAYYGDSVRALKRAP